MPPSPSQLPTNTCKNKQPRPTWVSPMLLPNAKLINYLLISSLLAIFCLILLLELISLIIVRIGINLLHNLEHIMSMMSPWEEELYKKSAILISLSQNWMHLMLISRLLPKLHMLSFLEILPLIGIDILKKLLIPRKNQRLSLRSMLEDSLPKTEISING